PGLEGINGSNRLQLELLRPFAFRGDRLRIVAGASYRYRKLDTADDQGHQTILRAPRGNHEGGLFGQADVQATAHLKLFLAGRLDVSDLYASELSPKIGAVYTLS